MNVLMALPLAAALSLRFRRRIEETLAPAIFILILILYISGIFTSFLPGVFACFAVTLTVVIWLVRHRSSLAAERENEKVEKLLLTPGALALLLFALYLLIANIGREFYSRDDFGHWALAVKNYLYYHDFSNIRASTDRNGTYPPAATLWNYFGALLFPRSGSFMVARGESPLSDAPGAQLFSQGMLMISLWLPVFSLVRNLRDRGQVLRFLILFSGFFLILTGSFTVTFGSAMVDPLLGLYLIYILWTARHRSPAPGAGEHFDSGCVCLALSLLALTKEMGIILALFAAIIVVLTSERGACRPRGIVSLGSVMLAVGSWYGYLALYDRLHAAGDGGGTVGGHVGGLLGGTALDPELSKGIIRDYLYGLVNWRTRQYGSLLPLSFLPMLFLLAVGVGYMIWRYRQGAKALLYLWIASWIYAVLLCLAYVVVFRGIAADLPSMERYLAPVIVGLLGLTTALLCSPDLEGKGWRKWLPLALLWIFLLCYGNLKQIAVTLVQREHQNTPVEALAGEIREMGITFRPGERVRLVRQEGSVSEVRYGLGYLVMPAGINKDGFEDLPEDGTDYEYLCLREIDGDFASRHGTQFADEDREEIDSFQWYRFDQEDDKWHRIR